MSSQMSNLVILQSPKTLWWAAWKQGNWLGCSSKPHARPKMVLFGHFVPSRSVNTYMELDISKLNNFSRGLWTWPPWVICAPAFNYKIRGFWSFVLHEILQVEETTVKEMDNWKVTPRDNVLLKISNSAPISRWLTDGSDQSINYNFSMWPWQCYFLAAIPLLKVP